MENLNRLLAGLLIVFCVTATIVGLGKEPTPARVVNLPLGERLVLVSLEGAISSSRSGFSSDALGVRDQLLDLAQDEQVKGVLLRIDSPGGTVGASQEIHDAVLTLSQQKPVVVSMGDVAASGGYYVACAADKIYANPGTLTGSIGVILSGYNARKLLANLGIEPLVIKSGAYKDIFSLNRPLNAAERTLLQDLIGDTYDQFLTAVAKGRNLPLNKVRPLADGRVFTGRQAQRVGLVDELGGLAEAKAALQRLAQKRFNLDQDLPLSEVQPSLDNLFKRFLPTTQAPLSNALQPLWLAPGLGPIHD